MSRETAAGQPVAGSSGTSGERLEDLLAERLERDPAFARAHHASQAKRALARVLVGLRSQAGLTLRELARRAGWSPGFVSRLESAEGPFPTMQTISHYTRVCRPDLVAGVVFARPQNDSLHVVGGVTLSATGAETGYFERLKEEDLTLESDPPATVPAPR